MKGKSKGLVILVRGIPGSGKSHHVEELRAKHDKVANDFVACSADKFFMQRVPVVRDGVMTQETRMEYNFDPSKIAQAHVSCMAEFIDALTAGTKVIVVDNTFIHLWEMKNYVKLANFAEYDVDYHEVRVKTAEELKVCVARNLHKVPANVIFRMASEFEPMDERCVNVWKIPFGGAR